MTSTGMRPPPDPNDEHDIEHRSTVDGVPDEEGIDASQVEDDLEQDPDEKRNATDGYAPADDKGAPDTLEMNQLED
jgi:hypothetical protein